MPYVRSDAQVKDKELQLALAMMLTDEIAVQVHFPGQGIDNHFHWKSGVGLEILDTEWLHVCYLARSKHELPVLVGSNEPWQEQARHILRHVKARDIILEATG